MDKRPDPQELLEQIAETEETGGSKGKLKIFFGYAAGVGKTYAMLEAAHAAKKQGIDVVAGYIEPHTRPETLALLSGLETLEPLGVPYKNITRPEFDLDSAIARAPQLILVDELAHTNAEGCRHKKRYQDVEELLRAGIDVYTTINVQHIESLNDIVASITGIVVQERIPDSVFDNSDQVELVDIEPDDLIERLNQGKIYRKSQAQRALHNFFVRENLVALREIALRRTADRVNKTVERSKALKGDYFTGEHILICVSDSPSSQKVIRTAARMADAFHAAFTALYVDTKQSAAAGAAGTSGAPGTSRTAGRFGARQSAGASGPSGMGAERDAAAEKRLSENVKLAEQLGARIATIDGDDPPLQIAEYAKTSGVSKIVVGRSNTKKSLLFAKPNFVERLTELAPNMDIYIIPDQVSQYKSKRNFSAKDFAFTLADTLKSLGILAAATLIGFWFYNLGFSEANIITVYILGVLITAMVTDGKVYSGVSSILSVLVFNFFFTVPRFTLLAYDKGYPVTFVVMFLASFLTSTMTMRVRKQLKQSAGKAYRTEVLLETSQKLQRADSREDIVKETAGQMKKLLSRTVLFYTGDGKAVGAPEVFPQEGDSEQYDTPDERAVAQWVYKNNKHAGATTNTLPGSKCLYLAVRSYDRVFAVVGIAMKGQKSLEAFEKSLLIAMLGECALAMEIEEINETKKKAEMKAQQEQLRANLLRAISHDLRTPLTSISGNAGMLMENSGVLDDGQKKRLYTDIYDDSMWLINLVENLLSITRFDNGSLKLELQPELMEDVVGEALSHISRKRTEHQIRVELSDDLLMARMDARLIVQVIINIVDNAIKYTPEGSAITVSAKKVKTDVLVEIADDGDGIPAEAKRRIFDMFFTEGKDGGDNRRGLGLGLALCKSIVEAHGGRIGVRDNAPKGTVFYFTLRSEEVDCHDE